MNHLIHDPQCGGLQETAPAELRARKLALLDVGDIVAAARNGHTVPFLVTHADETQVRARAITSQIVLTFDRTRGEATESDSGASWRIVVMQPLPSQYHQLMLSLDRRIRLGSNGTTNPLDEDDKRALLYLNEHWARYPI